MLTVNLSRILKARGIDYPHRFLVKAGFSRQATNYLVDGTHRNIKLDHIERLCKVLICHPHDFLVWTPDKGDNLPPEHPLNDLKIAEALPDWKRLIETLPYNQLKEVMKSFAGAKKQ